MRTEVQTLVRVNRWQPTVKFSAWVHAFTVYALHRSIQVERKTIYSWLNGIRAPREDNARAILLLSRRYPKKVGALTYEDIYGQIECFL